ncbi:MAG: DUF4442 domain-containing protein [Bacteroidia bacterium]
MKKPEAFYNKIKGPRFGLFLLFRLPLAYVAGVKLLHLDQSYCSTKIRFRWINQNPFRSLYFAAMHMAAELSTGLQLYQYQSKDFPFSMLLTQTDAQYFKKATGTIVFTCMDGKAIETLLENLNTKEQDVITLKVEVKDASKDVVAQFNYQWSLKARPRT